jgi:mRNA interferase YafQ
MARKRGLPLARLWALVRRIAANERLEPRYRLHKLSGEWVDCWECHIAPDWLLIWREEADIVEFLRTGTHSDLF